MFGKFPLLSIIPSKKKEMQACVSPNKIALISIVCNIYSPNIFYHKKDTLSIILLNMQGVDETYECPTLNAKELLGCDEIIFI